MAADELLAGRYRLEHIAGNGGMALVFQATDTVLERTVAIKYLQLHHKRDPIVLERFAREARAAAKIDSPHVVSVYDVGDGDERPFIVMEFVVGRSLSEIVRDDGRLPVVRALDYAEQVARGLAAAHALGIVHRDVKPANLIVDERGRVRITDFGLAHVPNEDVELTQPGSMLGSAYYIPPEQAAGNEACPASDLYSLGAVLYELLAGAPPFEGKTAVTVALAHLQTTPAPLASANPALPAELCTIVDELLEKDPTKRPGDAAALADRLARIAERERAEATVLAAPTLVMTEGDSLAVRTRTTGRTVRLRSIMRRSSPTPAKAGLLGFVGAFFTRKPPES